MAALLEPNEMQGGHLVSDVEVELKCPLVAIATCLQIGLADGQGQEGNGDVLGLPPLQGAVKGLVLTPLEGKVVVAVIFGLTLPGLLPCPGRLGGKMAMVCLEAKGIEVTALAIAGLPWGQIWGWLGGWLGGCWGRSGARRMPRWAGRGRQLSWLRSGLPWHN
jgi:hypothetical protein